jgi:hypothetical protein
MSLAAFVRAEFSVDPAADKRLAASFAGELLMESGE